MTSRTWRSSSRRTSSRRRYASRPPAHSQDLNSKSTFLELQQDQLKKQLEEVEAGIKALCKRREDNRKS